MKDVNNDRLSPDHVGPIFDDMQKTFSEKYQVPTAEELYALERRARDERARFLAAALRSAGKAVTTALQRAVAALKAKEVRHA